MTLSDKILSGLSVAFIIWLTQAAFSYLIKKHRLEKALIVDIHYHLLGISEAKNFINMLFEKVIKEGNTIKRTFHFAEDDYGLYKSVQNLLFAYFKHDKIEKLIKFYKLLWEAEHAIIGLIKDLEELKVKGESISADDFDFLQSKKERINSLLGILNINNVKKIDDLPGDYRHRKGPEHMVK